MTNGDWVRDSDNETLAYLIEPSYHIHRPWCLAKYVCPYKNTARYDCTVCALQWLNSEMEKEEIL